MQGIPQTLYFERYANFERVNEPVCVSIPFAKGQVRDLDALRVHKDGVAAPIQPRALAHWDDMSVKWAKVDFLANLPANSDAVYHYDFRGSADAAAPIAVTARGDALLVNNGSIALELGNAPGCALFRSIRHGDLCISRIDGPYVRDGSQTKYTAALDGCWEVVCSGSVYTQLRACGSHKNADGAACMIFVIDLTLYTETPWFEIQYRILNNHEPEYTHLAEIALDLYPDAGACTDRALATSNYRSNIRTAADGADLSFIIDADYLANDANEQAPEVFYGTFFANWRGDAGGICATHYQAYQNFPKGLCVTQDRLSVQILPQTGQTLKYYRGMAKAHRVFLHLHGPQVGLDAVNKRSLMLQHRDKPILSPDLYAASGVFPNIFPKERNIALDSFLMRLADAKGRAYGILHWGDCPDAGYSAQGRGGGEHVWTNNEYDYPYALMQAFALCGARRLLDFALVAAAHWVDIDVIHHDPDPLRRGAQVEHARDHVLGNIEISHMWVEGLFACYYQTGDAFMYDTAIEIGRNIVRHLQLPKYHKKGEVNARETGWALRALVALYEATNDDEWLAHADFIVSHFVDWKDTYGGWFSPYTDHTVVRVPFMIGIAACSLMRYYRIRPAPQIKSMIVDAVDDLLENAQMPCGLFYYKDLPGLRKPHGNTIVLEALASAYELTGDEKYLRAGLAGFEQSISGKPGGGGKKEKIPGGLLLPGPGPKGFAQSFYPLVFYYFHLCGSGVGWDLG